MTPPRSSPGSFIRAKVVVMVIVKGVVVIIFGDSELPSRGDLTMPHRLISSSIAKVVSHRFRSLGSVTEPVEGLSVADPRRLGAIVDVASQVLEVVAGVHDLAAGAQEAPSCVGVRLRMMLGARVRGLQIFLVLQLVVVGVLLLPLCPAMLTP